MLCDVLLTGVELDDHVFLQGQIDVIALRQGGDGGGEVFKVGGEPLGHHAAGAFLGSLEDGDILLGGLDADHIALLDGVGGDVHLLAVDGHQAVADELTGLSAAGGKAAAVDDIIQAQLEELEQVVAWCIENRYLDDNRFVGQFIASRSRKGYGPARIRQELSQKGIARQVVDQAMRECDIDWVSFAREQAQRKYGEPLPSAFTEKVKVQRFLLYRGYLMEDIQEIWRNFAD